MSRRRQPEPPSAAQSSAPIAAREAAVRAIEAALAGRATVDEFLAGLRADAGLIGREAALASELALGVVRHAETLNHVLQRVAAYRPHATAPVLRAILLSGAYQAVWLDRVPVFAAVSESVELARRLAKPAAARMINAILRSLTRAIDQRRAAWRADDPQQVRVNGQQACIFDRAVLPEPGDSPETSTALRAASTGERLAHYQSLVARHGTHQAFDIGWARQSTPPTVLQRNPLRCSPERFERTLHERYADQVAFADGCAFLAPQANPTDNPLFTEGRAWVQDRTARRAADLLATRPGESILDLCAAPGGKSIALAVAMEDQGRVVACDVNPRRLRAIAQNLARLDLYCVRTMILPAPDHSRRAAAQDASPGNDDPLPATCSDMSLLASPFDAALVDVPCSNTGVIARRPEARWTLSREKLESLTALQKRLLHAAAERVRAGGRLVYSTCSIEPEENEQLVDGFLREHADWRPVKTELTLPTWGEQPTEWRDGGYAALLMRNA